jgi:hypothetical protein
MPLFELLEEELKKYNSQMTSPFSILFLPPSFVDDLEDNLKSENKLGLNDIFMVL